MSQTQTRASVPGFQRQPSMTEALPATDPPAAPGSPPPGIRAPLNTPGVPPFQPSDGANGHRGSLVQRLTGGTRTGTSSEAGPTKPAAVPEFMSEKAAAGAAAAALGVLLMAGALAVRARYRKSRKLRQPTEDEERRITEPVARILHRHVPKGLTADVFDGLAAAAAFGTYINNGDLTVEVQPAATDPAAGDLSELGD